MSCCGLMNLGNTCYMNSIIQILSHTQPFTKYIFSINVNSTKKENNLLIKFICLLKELKEQINGGSISPQLFLMELHNYASEHNLENFTGYDQNDASEFLIILIDYIYKTIERKVVINIKGKPINKKDNLTNMCFNNLKKMYSEHYSEILNIFYGYSITNIISGDKIVSSSPQSYFMLNLPIPTIKSKVNIKDCLNLYLEEEKIDYSHENESKLCIKQTLFYNFPDVLIISLNRFNYRNVKNHKIVNFPLENLDLNSYVNGYNSKNDYVYDLYGICNHSGSCLGGHYTSIIKTSKDKWCNFNDRLVSEITINVNDFYSKAYVLFYIKKKQ
jgi:ubiquitin carboxyl-terminal hydrolase 2/21